MYYIWMSRVRWMTPIFKDWGFFSFGYFAIVIEQILGLSLIIQTLSAIAFSEWAVVSALMTVVGALTQLGLKTAYMQLVADQTSRSRQYQALRATFIFLGVTGFLGGSLIAVVLAVCAEWGIWENTELLWVLPWVLMCTNLQMVLVTELRLSDRVRSFVILSYQRSLVFVLAIGCLSQIFKHGLHLIYWAQLVAGVYMVLRLFHLLQLHRFISVVRWQFLPPAISLAWPAMVGLLLKYGSDAMVSMGMRWLCSVELAADYGRSLKLLEPFNALFFTAFVMAWGANSYIMAADAFLRKKLSEIARVGLSICFLGLILAYPAALLMQLMFSDLAQTSLASNAFMMVLARFGAFAAMSPVQFAWILVRNYRWSMMFNGLELFLTGIIFLICLYQEQYILAFWAGALIPWLVVALQYGVGHHIYQCHKKYL